MLPAFPDLTHKSNMRASFAENTPGPPSTRQQVPRFDCLLSFQTKLLAVKSEFPPPVSLSGCRIVCPTPYSFVRVSSCSLHQKEPEHRIMLYRHHGSGRGSIYRLRQLSRRRSPAGTLTSRRIPSAPDSTHEKYSNGSRVTMN